MRRRGAILIFAVTVTACLSLLGLVGAAPAWAGWSQPATFPANDCFTAVGFANDQVGWVVGQDDPAYPANGVIFKTTDGGVTWTPQGAVGLLAGTIAFSMHVFDAQTVIIGAGNNHILKTVDGGTTWLDVKTDATNFGGDPFGLSFINESTGWLATVGYETAGNLNGYGRVYKTTDRGVSWTMASPVNDLSAFKGIEFYDADNGIVVGMCSDGPGNFVSRTTNGGTTWTRVTLDPARTDTMNGLVNLDATHAWVVGGNGSIFFSSDGGASWTRQQPIDTAYDLGAVDFINTQVGWAVGSVDVGTSVILKTVDGGANWTRQPAAASIGSLIAVDFVSATRGFAASYENHVVAATNGGDAGDEVATITTLTSSTHPSQSRYYDSTSPAFAWTSSTAAVDDYSYVLDQNATTTPDDTGEGAATSKTYTAQAAGTWYFHVKAHTGAGWGPTRNYTVNLGPTPYAPVGWSKPNLVDFSPDDNFTALGFADDQVGWVVGVGRFTQDGFIMKTIDGGVTWTTEDTGSLLVNRPVESIQVIDAQTVIVAAEGSCILKTADGGDTWFEVKTDATNFEGMPLGLSFTDADHGWLATAGDVLSQVFKTTDGGKTWSLPSPVDESGPLRGIDFYDADNGIATGLCYDDVSHRDYVWRTTNGGASWAKSFLPVDPAAVPDGLNGPTSNQYKDYTYAVVNLDATHAWVVGGWGAIFFSSNNGLTWTRQQAVDSSYDLYSVDFVDTMHGWAAGTVSGASDVILHTVDGGATWTRQPATLSPGVFYSDTTLMSIDFVSVNRGFTCGEFDVVLKATNGGEPGVETWPSVITVTQTAGGTIAPGTGPVDYGASPVYTITPDPGNQIASVTVDGTPQVLSPTYQFFGVVDVHTITATYTAGSDPPAGTMRINNGSSSTSVVAVDLCSDVTNATLMRFSDTPIAPTDPTPSWQAFDAHAAWTLPAGSGSKTVYAEYSDGTTTLDLSDAIQLDSTYPGGTMQINGGASSAASLEVTLVNSVTNATEMRFRDGPAGTWTTWEAFAATKAWTLLSAVGAQTVEAQFRNDADPTKVLDSADSIVIDGTLPSGEMLVGDGSPYSNAPGDLTLHSAVTGADQMRFRSAGGSWSTWAAYGATASLTPPVGDGLKIVEAQYRLVASPTKVLDCSASVLLDTVGPNTPSGVTAAWVQIDGSDGVAVSAYTATEAPSLTELITTTTLTDSDGIPVATGYSRGEALSVLINGQFFATLPAGQYDLSIALADAAGNPAPSSRTAALVVQ